MTLVSTPDLTKAITHYIWDSPSVMTLVGSERNVVWMFEDLGPGTVALAILGQGIGAPDDYPFRHGRITFVCQETSPHAAKAMFLALDTVLLPKPGTADTRLIGFESAGCRIVDVSFEGGGDVTRNAENQYLCSGSYVFKYGLVPVV